MKKLWVVRFCALLGLFCIGLSFCLLSPSDNFIRDRVVKLQSEQGSCSGEQIVAPSGQTYILTAGHCRGLADGGYITAVTEDGKTLQRRVIAEDPKSDLLLLEGLPHLSGLKIAQFELKRQKVITFTHGRGFDTYSTEGVLIQYVDVKVPTARIENDDDAARCARYPKNFVYDEEGLKLCVLDVEEVATTAKIIPESSGGPVVNESGELVGVCSAGDPEMNYLVRLVDIKNFLHNY